MGNDITYHDTAYYGIQIRDDNGEYILMSTNGDEEYHGMRYPTEQQITNFRNRIMR